MQAIGPQSQAVASTHEVVASSITPRSMPEPITVSSAIVAAVLIFLPVTANQVAAILAVVAVATGEQVVRKVRPA